VWRWRNFLGVIDELGLIEQWFGTDDPVELVARYDAAIEVLGSEDVDAWLDLATAANVSGDSAEHFRVDWLGGNKIPGVDRKSIEAGMREGFAAALTTARDNLLKLSVVVVAADTPDGFAVDHAMGANAVTVVIGVPAAARADEASA